MVVGEGPGVALGDGAVGFGAEHTAQRAGAGGNSGHVGVGCQGLVLGADRHQVLGTLGGLWDGQHFERGVPPP